MTIVLIVAGLLALALVLVGAFALIRPDGLARVYGLPVEGEAARGFVRATGIRDLVIGTILGAAVYFRDVPLLVVLASAGIVLSLGDLLISYHGGGKRLRREHGLHAGGVVAFVLVLAMVLFAIGR
jgi:hypothetical protein